MNYILVTGGLGYIGSHTVVMLQSKGYEVVIVDNLSNSESAVLKAIEKITDKRPVFHAIDVNDLKSLQSLFEKYSFTAVIHFAAHKSVSESVKNPLKYYKNNIVGLLNILEVMEAFKVKNFIFSSSCTVYGQADQMPINEQTPLKTPLSPYGKTKQMGEIIIEDWIKATGFKAIILRYFNPIGAHPSLHLGEWIKGEPDNLLPYIIKTALKHYDFVKVFGNNYPTKDGTAIRDYVDVNDLADAHVKALTRLLNNSCSNPFECYNLGAGKGYSVLEIINSFEKINKVKIPYNFFPKRVGDIAKAYADFNKAYKVLKWEPKITIEESLRNSWNFEKNNIKNYI